MPLLATHLAAASQHSFAVLHIPGAVGKFSDLEEKADFEMQKSQSSAQMLAIYSEMC